MLQEQHTKKIEIRFLKEIFQATLDGKKSFLPPRVTISELKARLGPEEFQAYLSEVTH